MSVKNQKILLGLVAAILLIGGYVAYSASVETDTVAYQQVDLFGKNQTGGMEDMSEAVNPGDKDSQDTNNEDMESDNLNSATSMTPKINTMLVAGGCFWCVEADLEKLPGVIEVVSGYSSGTSAAPTYENYGSGGHREVVEVTYDTSKISFEQILIVTMKTTDPTDDEGTFADRGDKYSSAFYYKTEEQKAIIDNLIVEVDVKGPYDKPLAIDVEAETTFYTAEDYHQDYYKGTLSQLKYQYYRNASGRDKLIEQYWGSNTGPTLPWRTSATNNVSANSSSNMWENYVKPSKEILKTQLDAVTFNVTQEDGTANLFRAT